MDRVNFYQLLELQINPPESDLETIESAIKRKQAEWSRLRNHPTKGIIARQNISLLPEIRKIMGDPKLREQEAQAAVELLKAKLEAKLKLVDHQIKLVGCKGEILPREIEKIAALNGIKPNIVQKRIDRWQKGLGAPVSLQINRLLIQGAMNEAEIDRLARQYNLEGELVRKIQQRLLDSRMSEVEAFIGIQVRKGYMTQNEIADLASIYPFGEGEILRRIRCPIKKKANQEEESAYQIDGTVEQVINENLKVVGHESLYGFLGLFPGSSLEALQKKALEKENAIRKISHKDALVTSSGILAGQCIAIFKSDESRYAYDLSRARSFLKKLNHDIDLAENDARISHEQFDFLLRQAVQFGTLPQEARQHIIDHCQAKGWQIVFPKKKKNLKKYYRTAAAVTICLLLGGGAFWYFLFSSQHRETEYLRMRAEAGRQESLEGQIRMLQQYIDSQSDKTYQEKAQQEIEGLRKRIEFRDLTIVKNQVEAFFEQKNYEAAASLYESFIAKHPGSAHIQALRQDLDKIPDLIDQRDYQRVAQTPEGDLDAVAAAIQAYYTQHPRGTYQNQVRQIASRIAKPYYNLMLTRLANCEKNQDWNSCIALCDRYILLYKDSQYALQLMERRDALQINLQNAGILADLQRDAGGAQATPQKLVAAYQAFLARNPNTPARSLILAELDKLNLVLRQQAAESETKRLQNLLKSSSARFQMTGANVFRDKKTGRTWTMLDSQMELGECVNYAAATKAVAAMKTGGYSDWRLPTVEEIKELYAGGNFPGNSASWYWTANNMKRYSGGWIIEVDTVAVGGPAVAIRKRDATECGWFRAVR
jgi:hypothetical protein